MNISLVDIKKAIISLLSNKYPDHTFYTEKIPRGFKKPSFFMYFVPLESLHDSRYFVSKAVLVKIEYYSQENTNEGNWLMSEQLERIFHNDLVVNNRYLTINRTTSEYVDDNLVFTINISFENGSIEIIKVENNDGENVWLEKSESNEKLGYTEQKIELMRDLEIE